MALNQNQFTISTTKGTLEGGIGAALSMSVEFYDASPAATVSAGEWVVLSSTTSGNVTRVAKGADLESSYFGVVLTNPLKDTYAVGDKLEIGILGSVVHAEASAAITCGAKVQYNPATAKVATQTASNTVVGVAIENAVGDASLVRVMVLFP
jgi:hypothetical protein